MREMSNRESAIWLSISLIAAISTSAYSYYFGDFADQQAEAKRLAAHAVAPETVQVATTNASLELLPIEELRWGEGRVRYTPGWMFLRTDSWVILPNADEGKMLCPSVLRDFVDSHKPQGKKTNWTLRNIDALVRSHKNTTVDLRVHVPRPTVAPKGLEACPAVGYDASNRMLTYGGRPIAVLAEEQIIKIAPIMPPRSVPRFNY